MSPRVPVDPTVILRIPFTILLTFQRLRHRVFFLDDWAPLSFTTPDFTLTGPAGGTATDTVNIDLNKVITKVPKWVYGNNANPYMSQIVDQPVLLNHINKLAPRVIRFPGGNLSSLYFWDQERGQAPADVADTLYDTNLQPYEVSPGEPHYTYWAGKNNESWSLSLANYYTVLQHTNSKGMITVNYPYARYGLSENPVAVAAHNAANWVRHDAGRTKFWEIGNEVNGPWQAGYKINTRQNKDGQPEIINGTIYGQHFKVFVDSMKKAAQGIGSTIYIGAVLEGVDATNSWNVTARTWNNEFFIAAGNAADFFIVHDYFQDATSSARVILNSAEVTIPKIAAYLKTNTAANLVQMKPIALTEWNIWATGSKQMVSNVAGVHATLALGEIIKNKFGQAARWDLANAWDNGDDHGTFNNGFSNPAEDAWNPRPSFFHMYYFQKFFGDRMVESAIRSNSGAGDLVAYASSFSSGEAGVILVNKGTSNRTVAVNFKHFKAGNRYYWYTLSGSNDNGEYSTKVLVNGQTNSGAVGGPTDYSAVKAMAAPLTGTLKVAVPPGSVVYMVAAKP
ncbi:MAG: alpha-L-arabinofuranosidase [Chitinophagaceae bacterium]|nr:alpha-L-arabinofuranosidase [Chitinophagaceae bacterium]